jgi:glycosyltransferase involved in cell wall biosynthesis
MGGVPGRKPSILLVGTDLSSGGGVNRVIRDLAAILSGPLGMDVTVVSARSTAEPTYPFSPEVRLERLAGGESLLGYLRNLVRLRRRGYDFVVGFWAQDNILLAAAFLGSRTRVILAEHISWFYPSRFVRRLRAIAYRAAWRVLVLNRAEAQHYRRFLGNIELIPNPVPPIVLPDETRPEKLILAVGHLIPHKNFRDLLVAMHRSGLEAQGWSLAIVGAGPEEEMLRGLISEFGLARSAVYPPTRVIRDWYARASILVVCSKVEVFSLVLAEGIQAGLVPLAYAADGPAFILDRYPEQLVPIGDVDALAARLKGLASDPNLRGRGLSIREAVAPRFSEESIAEQWRTLLAGGFRYNSG